MKHPALFLLAFLPLLVSSGCMGMRHRPLSYRDYDGGGVVHADYYEAECDSCHGVNVGLVGSSCESGHCNRCDGNTHVPVGAYAGLPLAARLKQRLACGDGCGEVYFGEWISTPPTPDPCDYDGNYTGVGNDMTMHSHAQPVRSLLRKIVGIRFLGTRYADDWIDPSDCCGTGDAFDSEVFDAGMHESIAPSYSTAATYQASMNSRAPVGKPSCNCGH